MWRLISKRSRTGNGGFTASRLAALVLLALVAGCIPKLAAQNIAAQLPRLTLASATGAPGGSLVVPIYFDSEGRGIGRLRFETTFVSRNLKLQKFTAGSAAETAETQVASDFAESKDDQGLEHTTLTVTFQATDAARPIPAGLLGYISLRVGEKAGPAIISFHSKVEATLASGSAASQDVEIVDDQVEIIAEGSEPLISCFFFTH